MPTPWSAFTPEIAPSVPGCPIFAVELAARRATQDMCRDARPWRESLPDAAVTAGTASVAISTGNAETSVARVERAWWDGRRLDPKSVDEMDDAHGDNWRTHTGDPYLYVEISPGTVTLYPKPTADGTLATFAALQPSEVATGVPDDIARLFRDTIIAGAKARLMLDPEKAWSNPSQAAIEMAVFQQGVGSAQHQAATGFGRSRIVARKKWC